MEPELIGPIVHRQLKVIRRRMELQRRQRIMSAVGDFMKNQHKQKQSQRPKEEKSLFSVKQGGI